MSRELILVCDFRIDLKESRFVASRGWEFEEKEEVSYLVSDETLILHVVSWL